MTQLLPERFLTLHEATEVIERALFAGQPTVLRLRADDLNVREREARTLSIQFLWSGVDAKRVNAFAALGEKIVRGARSGVKTGFSTDCANLPHRHNLRHRGGARWRSRSVGGCG